MKNRPYPTSIPATLLQNVWLSGPEARRWLTLRGQPDRLFETTFDLNRTHERARVRTDGIERVHTTTVIPWELVEEVADFEHACFLWDHHRLERIRAYSERFGRYCSLMATSGAPTLLIAGFPMHRIKGTDPWQDTAWKLRTLKPIRGRVLDTCTGLGYTAIQAARWAEEVVTVELDRTVLELARRNPWSFELFFDRSITRVVDDVVEWTVNVEDASIDRIVHDPPTVELAGDLYGEPFYRALCRVLKPGGRLFHYTGDPRSGHGARVVQGVVRRLQSAGFRRVRIDKQAHGVVAVK